MGLNNFWLPAFLLSLLLVPPAPAFGVPSEPTQKIWMMQINPIVGDVEHNVQLIEAQYRQAVASGADVVMTPELAVIGYPARDLLRNREMLPRVSAGLEHLRKLTESLRTPDGRKVALVVGHPGPNRNERGKELQNRTTVFYDGKIIHEHNKRMLPTYDIFDEKRYFEEGTETYSFELNGVVYAILTCEEGWFKDRMFGREIYLKDPADDVKQLVERAHAQGKPFVILDDSASPWYFGKHPTRVDLHAEVARRTGADAFLYDNMWGGNDQILFDGHSFVMGRGGTLLGQMDPFKDGHGMVEVPTRLDHPVRLANRGQFSLSEVPENRVLYDGVVTGIRDYFRKSGLKGAVVGLSGGKDSGVIAQLFVEALGSENVIGVSMPSSISSSHSKNDARELAEKLHIRYQVKPIAEFHNLARSLLEIKPGELADENVQARIRGLILWTIANQNPGFTPAGTGNKDEYTQGYATIFGDVMPINFIADADVGQVRALGWEGNHRGVSISSGKAIPDGKGGFQWQYDGKKILARDTIPASTLTKPPSAELRPGQIDEDNLPPYDVMDQMVHDLENRDLGPATFLDKWSNAENWGGLREKSKLWPRERLEKFLNTYQVNEIKRLLSAVTLKISPRAFGPGRTQVIAKRYFNKGLHGEFEKLGKAPIDSALPVVPPDHPQSAEVVAQILPKFRSADRYIPAVTLYRQSWPKIGKDLLHSLGGLTQDELLRGIYRLAMDHPELKVDQGVAENLLKIQQMYKLCQDACVLADENDAVPGLEQTRLDQLVAALPPNAHADSSKPEGEFDYVRNRAESRVKTRITNSDLYNFKVAADYWGNHLHDKYEVTASLYSRGHEKRPFIVSLGQEETLDLLKNLHFTEEEIQFLRSNRQFKHVPEGFWDYLRNFRFQGTIRGVKPGTVIYADEPILEVTGNPIEVQIVETLVIPWINKMSNWATKAERVVRVAGGRVVVEGGTRRGADGMFSAKAAFVGGAQGTSNVEAAMIYGIPAYGSQNHFSIMMYTKESEAQGAFLRYFPDSSLLTDTNGPEVSVRQAILAAGPELTGIRLDSTLPGKNKAETARWARNLLDHLGYQKTKITYSDGINEQELASMPRNEAPIDNVLVGTELAAPSDTSNLNVVYKLTQVRNKATGEIFDPVKKASGKLSLPGEHALWRGAGKDLITEFGEPGPVGAKRLTMDLMVDGRDVFARDPLPEQQKYVREQVERLPANQLALDAPREKQFFEISPKLRARQEAAVNRTSTTGKPELVLVVPGFFSPPTDSHMRLIQGMRELYGGLYSSVKVVVVPSGSETTNGKTHAFTPNQRFEMLKRRLGGDEAMKRDGISIYRGELEGKSRYTIDTMKAIEAEHSGEKAEFAIVLGEDVLNGANEKNLLKNWKDVDELFRRYDFIFHPRAGGRSPIAYDHTKDVADFIRFLPDSQQGKLLSFNPFHAENPETGRFVQVASVGAGEGSSTAVRKNYEQVDTVYLDIDTMKTFWEGMHGEPDGALPVKGTRAITPTVATMKRLAYADPKGKAITARDTHHRLEREYPDRYNPEFKIFDRIKGHANIGQSGPYGDEPIPESDIFPSDQQHRIPHLREKNGELVSAEYNEDANADLYRDPNVELIFEKSGAGINPHTGEREGSFSISNNPHFQSTLDQIHPKRYVVWGVCTDFCVDRSLWDVLKRRERGEKAEVVVITDAIAGVDPEMSRKALAGWAEQGVELMTARQYVEKYRPELRSVLAASSSDVSCMVKRIRAK